MMNSKPFTNATNTFQIRTTNDLYAFMLQRAEATESKDVGQLHAQIKALNMLYKMQINHMKPQHEKQARSNANLRKGNKKRIENANDAAIENFDDWQKVKLRQIRDLTLDERVRLYRKTLTRKISERIRDLHSNKKLQNLEENELYR